MKPYKNYYAIISYSKQDEERLDESDSVLVIQTGLTKKRANKRVRWLTKNKYYGDNKFKAVEDRTAGVWGDV